jgi:hypothetical protein
MMVIVMLGVVAYWTVPVGSVTYGFGVTTAVTRDIFGNLIQGATRGSLQVSCRAGESDTFQATAANGNLLYVFVNCSQARRLFDVTQERWVHRTTSYVKTVTQQQIKYAESGDTEDIPNEATAFARAANNPDYVAGRRRGAEQTTRTATTHPRSTVRRTSAAPTRRSVAGFTVADLAGAIAGIGTAAALGGGELAAPGFGVAFGGLATLLAVDIVDTSGVSADQINQDIGAVGSQNYLACAGIAAGGVGIQGLGSCIDRVFAIVNSEQQQIQALQSEVTVIEAALVAENQLIQEVQAQQEALTSTVLALGQSVQNIQKVQGQGNYVQSLQTATEAVIASNIGATQTTQSTNNQNLLTVVQQTQQTFQTGLTQVSNALLNFELQTADQITLEVRQIYATMATQLAVVKNQFNSQLTQVVLNDLSAATQINTAFMGIAATMSDMNTRIQFLLQQNALASNAVSQLSATMTTQGANVLHTYYAFGMTADHGELPVIQNDGTPPMDTSNYSKIMGRQMTATLPRICNNAGPSTVCRSCITPFGVGAPVKALAQSMMENTVVFSAQVPTTIDINFPLYGDTGYLKVWTGSQWAYLTSNPSCGCPVAYSMCTTTNQAQALQFYLQNYAWYKQSNTVTAISVPYIMTPLSCNTTALAPNVTLATCLAWNNQTSVYNTCSYTLTGAGCTSFNAIRTAIESNSTITCIPSAPSCTGPSSYLVYQSNVLPITQPATNVYHYDQIYLDVATSPFGGTIVAAANQTTVSSNAFYLGVPPTDGNGHVVVTSPFVFTVTRANATSINVYQPIDNATPFVLTTDTGFPWSMTGNCFMSSSTSMSNPAQFIFVPVNPTGPAGNDTGIPIARRSSDDGSAQPIETPIESSIERRSSSRRSTPPNCNAAGIFHLINSPTEKYPSDIAACTAIAGCVLARIPRNDSATFTWLYNQASVTIPLGISTLNYDPVNNWFTLGTVPVFNGPYGTQSQPTPTQILPPSKAVRWSMQVSTGLRVEFMFSCSYFDATGSSSSGIF